MRERREVVKRDCQVCELNKEDAVDRSRWRKLIKDVWWSGWGWIGECFFWCWPTWVVLDKKPLNGCACVTNLLTLCEKQLLYTHVSSLRNFGCFLLLALNTTNTRRYVSLINLLRILYITLCWFFAVQSFFCYWCSFIFADVIVLFTRRTVRVQNRGTHYMHAVFNAVYFSQSQHNGVMAIYERFEFGIVWLLKLVMVCGLFCDLAVSIHHCYQVTSAWVTSFMKLLSMQATMPQSMLVSIIL